MKKKLITLSAFLISAVLLITGCNNENKPAETSATTTANASVTTESTTELSDVTPADNTEKLNRFMSATLGDTIDFSEYRIFQKSDGTKVYFANGRYLFVVENTVIEIREAVTVANPNASIYDVLLADKDFDAEKCKAYFYDSTGASVNWEIDSRLTSDVSQAVVEYVDWKDDDQTTGILHSYIFSYNDAPIKVVAVYSKSMEEAAQTSDSATTEATPEVTTAEGETTTAETTKAPAESE